PCAHAGGRRRTAHRLASPKGVPRAVPASSPREPTACRAIERARAHATALALLTAAAGCTGDGAGLDARGDSFDHDALDDDSRCAVLKLANVADRSELIEAAGVHPTAADAIVDHRQGSDGRDDTPDDARFESLGQLDAVPWMGPRALERMRAYVEGDDAAACGEQSLHVLGFNDFHGALQPPTGSNGRIATGPGADEFVPAGGVEYFATHVAQLRAQADHAIVVSAGDLIGATPLLSALFHDEPTVLAMSVLGLDDAGVGNHEFDRGRDELLRLQAGGCEPRDGCVQGTSFAGAAFDFLATNVIDERTDAPVLPPSAVHWVGNARLAVLSLTLHETPSIISADAAAGLRFDDEIAALQRQIEPLRARGIEAFAVLLHQAGGQAGSDPAGCDDFDGPVRSLTEQMPDAIDLVIAGHTDGPFVCTVGDVLVTSAASHGRMITDIALTLDERTGDVVAATAAQVVVTRDVPRDPSQITLLSSYAQLAAPLADRVVGRIDADLPAMPDDSGASPLGYVVADAQLSATLVDPFGGAEIAFTNPGGVRADLAFAPSGKEAPGEVTYGELFAVQPFGNNLVTMTLRGDELVALLEQQWQAGTDGTELARILLPSSGIRYRWDPAAPRGSRVVPGSLSFDGVAIADADEFRVTVNAFLAGGGDGFTVLRQGRDVTGGMLELSALEAYVTDRSPVSPPVGTRIERR
ncbi:MAG: 5'-nucleotidase C-terminal domain-containing protein, partial [Nannocystaceae bacterium]|nr:5'-nucleotidase C-terminal domain-containing protein [Nannocystaceae bacterium]